jgi:hypothetical protein
MRLTQRIAAAVLTTGMLMGGGLTTATIAHAGGPSNGTGISQNTVTYPGGVKLSTVSGFTSASACWNAKSAKIRQVESAGYKFLWASGCFARGSKLAFQVRYR